MSYISNLSLTPVFERLGVDDVRDIAIEEGGDLNRLYYVARSRSRRTFIDRPLAVQLRVVGAVWCGDISRDPCAVA